MEELLAELRRRYRAVKGRSEGAMYVIASGQPELRTDVVGQPQMEIPDEAAELYEQLSPRSYMIVPLTARGRTIGALTFLSTIEGRHYGPADLDFAQHLARRFGLAVDNARLYQEAENARDRLSFMAKASELLSASLDLDQTLQQVAMLAVSSLADWCTIELLEDDGNLRNAATAHVDPDQVKLAQELRTKYPIDPDDPAGVPNVIRTGRSELYPQITDELLVGAARDEEHLRLMRGLGLRSVLVVPLTARGHTLGAITLVSAESGRQYGVDDLRFAEELAHRAAVAVDNSRLYDREHRAAVTLQQSLLPRQLPEVPGVEFAARYLPATSELDVGGDWYDAIPLGDGSVGVAVGDVVGHGVEAAAVMGQFRNALRAYVLDGRGPDAAVEQLNRLTRTFDQNDMATLVYVVIDTASGGFRFVRAGHPPPLIRNVDGDVMKLNGQGALPVGVAPNVRYPATAMRLEPGATLLLYTDGLVERRGEPLEAGIEKLERVLADAPEPLEELCDHLLSVLAPDVERDDDICLLAIRPIELEAERFHTMLRADPTELSRLRRLLMRWLRLTQASAQEIYDITIAAGEACANAIEHAYGARAAHRGRGLQLIEALMEDVEIDRSERGTEVRMRRRLSALEES
jgi:GAF domain-containing protein